MAETSLLLLIILVSSISVGVITSNHSSATRSALSDQSASNMLSIVGDGRRLLDLRFAQLTQFVQIVAGSVQDLTRSDFIYGLLI